MIASVKGYVLYSLLIVSTIGFIILSITLYGIRSTLRSVSYTVHKAQAEDLAESGISRAEYFLNGNDGHSISWETAHYEEPVDSFGNIVIQVQQAGLFSRIVSIGKRKTFSDTVSGLVGRNVPDMFNHSMVLTSVSGGCLFLENTSVQGTIVLHHGFITNKPHGRRPLPGYEKKVRIVPSPKVPFDSVDFCARIRSMMKADSLTTGKGRSTGTTYRLTSGSDSLFSSEIITISGDLYIDAPLSHKKICVTGNTYLTEKGSCNTVWLKAKKINCTDAQSSHCLFIADSGIVIKGGWHNSQFIATDSIKLLDNPGFGTANCVATLRTTRKDSSFTGGIYFHNANNIKGTLISLIDQKCIDAHLVPYDVSIVLEPGFHLKGYIVTDHDINIQKGTIEGGFWARSVVTKYDSVSYTNAMIGITIKALKEEILFPLLGDPPVQVIISSL
ncbi:MAG TPA: hypothetical protein VHO70_10695 [Chitinispirillaceae bacterium]|nr:hypothetical protein [Chitinispirillaceae bacterium]